MLQLALIVDSRVSKSQRLMLQHVVSKHVSFIMSIN